MDFTFLCCTYNRAEELAEMLESACRQEAQGYSYDVLVVDNKSTDHTRAIVEQAQQKYPGRIHYYFEARPGKSYALATGLAHCRGEIYQIADDDLIFTPDHVQVTLDLLRQHPDWKAIGGQVIPRWNRTPPLWLSEDHYGTLALTQYGSQIVETSQARPWCLLAAAYCTETVREVGGYVGDLAVSGKNVGGVEDVELFYRIYAKGYRCGYVPDIRVEHKVEAYRCEKAYHRRWHRGHGRNLARISDPSIDVGRKGPFSVPLYLYKQALREAGLCAWHALRGAEKESFLLETRLWCYLGFIEERMRPASD